MPYDNAQDIINDALFRAGEIPGASEWDSKALDYLNRSYQAICSGASEFLPEIVHDWWWLRENGVLTLEPVIDDGTISVTKGSTSFTISPAVSTDIEGRRLQVGSDDDIFKVASYSPGSGTGTFDSEYTGDTDSSASYKAMKTIYSLGSDVAAIMSPISLFNRRQLIYGTTPERLDDLYPISNMKAGIPHAFALEDERTVRFSHGGRDDGTSMRMEFRYRPVVSNLQNLTNSIPLLPVQWRHVLSDTTLTYIFMDKNDDRATSAGSSARATLSAMFRENTRRFVKMDKAGKIEPRPSVPAASSLQTESGIYIRN